MRQGGQQVPKLLLPIRSEFGTPTMLEHQLLGLAQAGFKRVLVMVANDEPLAAGNEIAKHVRDVCPDSLSLAVLSRAFNNNTAGLAYEGAKIAVTPTIMIVNGDTLYPYPKLLRAAQRHVAAHAPFTLAVTTNPGEAAQYSGKILVARESSRIVHFLEQRFDTDPAALLTPKLCAATSTGIFLADRSSYCRAFDANAAAMLASPNGLDLHKELIPRLVEAGERIDTYDVQVPTPDLGTPERYQKFGNATRPPPSIGWG